MLWSVSALVATGMAVNEVAPKMAAAGESSRVEPVSAGPDSTAESPPDTTVPPSCVLPVPLSPDFFPPPVSTRMAPSRSGPVNDDPWPGSVVIASGSIEPQANAASASAPATGMSQTALIPIPCPPRSTVLQPLLGKPAYSRQRLPAPLQCPSPQCPSPRSADLPRSMRLYNRDLARILPRPVRR